MNNKYKNLIAILALIITLAITAIFSVQKVGFKDGASFTLSVFLVVAIVTLAFKDMKKAMYLFIISMPVLVTARKLFYVDLFILKVNFETLLILFFFIINFEAIKNNIVNKINENKSERRWFYYIVVFVLGSYLSAMFSSRILRSLELTTTSVLLPVLLLSIVVTIFDKSDIKYIVYSLIISVNLSCMYGVLQVAGLGFNLNTIIKNREYLTFGYHNGNIFVIISMMVYPLLLNELLYKKNAKSEKIFLVVSLLMQSCAVLITFSRGAWLALGMICVAILFSKKYKYIFAAIFILGVLATPFVLPKILSRGSSDMHYLQNTSNSARVQSIVTSIEMMRVQPFGVGYGEFNTNFRESVVDGYLSIPQYWREKMAAPLYSLESAHNYLLNIGVELGVFSLIAMTCILLQRLRVCVKDYKANRGLFIALLMFIFLGITTGIEINHKGVLTNTYILWILLGMISLNSEITSPKNGD